MKRSVWYFTQAQNLIRYKDLVSLKLDWVKNIAITPMSVGFVEGPGSPRLSHFTRIAAVKS